LHIFEFICKNFSLDLVFNRRKCSPNVHPENEGVFSTDNQILFCKLYDIRVNSQKRFTVNQHLKTAKHLRAVNRLKTNAIKTNQNLVSNAICGKHSVFNEDLCKMMLSANIPLSKLNNKFLSEFLIKYTNKDIPNESTLRKNYVTDIYKKKNRKY